MNEFKTNQNNNDTKKYKMSENALEKGYRFLNFFCSGN